MSTDRARLDSPPELCDTRDIGTAPSLDEIGAVLRRHLPGADYHAYLFGSRARGNARPMSDWDIGMVGPTPVRGALLEEIREDFEELRTLHRVDVVDLATTTEGFQTRALRDAVLLV